MDDRKNAQVGFRLSVHDRETLEKYARDAGKSISEFIRSQTFRITGDRKVQALQLIDGQVIPIDHLQKARFIICRDPVTGEGE
ncbi:MAG: hypothetical protein JXQ30_13810 [Spirochaetes bacterium]|nr:hypothetical protein [Spirochaetota bacterium]